MDKLSEMVEKQGFEVAAIVSHPSFFSDKIKELNLPKGYEFIILPRSQVKGSASEYTIYKSWVGKENSRSS